MAKSSSKSKEVKATKVKSENSLNYSPKSAKAMANFSAPRMGKVEKNMRAAAMIHSMRQSTTRGIEVLASLKE